MKKLILITALLSFALAAIAPTGALNVYAQVWKGGVTDMAGQGADIQAVLFYSTETFPGQFVAMSYQGDVGSNDEYVGVIPQAHIAGAQTITVDVIFTDLTDMMETPASGDQNGTPPPLVYNIVDVTPVPIDVTFTVCMSGMPTTGDVCVIGSAAEIGTWGTGVNLVNMGGDLWSGVVTFAAGSNPVFEYKYKKDGCSDWEPVGNRMVTLPTDNTSSVVLPADSWANAPMGCGMGVTLDADREICFQVCMDGVDPIGGVCTVGNIAELTSWGAGTTAQFLGGGIYQTCLTFPAGTAIPLTIEYKFKKDDCNTWESVGNRTIVLDNALAPETTLTSTWDNGPGACQPVADEPQAWGAVKSMYR
jgi:hypothetical protein